MILIPSDTHVRPDHLAALQAEMAGKGGDWKVFAADPDIARYVLTSDFGDAVAFVTVHLLNKEVFDMNVAEEAESSGRRFGDGKVVARIPLNMLDLDELNNVSRALDEGDRQPLRKMLNDPDYKKFRCFRGRI